MKIIRFGILSASISLMIVLIQCSKDNPVNTNASDRNPVISGVLYGSDGSICKNAIVQMRVKSGLADTSEPALNKKASYSPSTTSDESGRFSFDADLDPDIYVIDAKSGDNAVLIDSVRVLKRDSNIVLAAATLKSVGAIKGKVELTLGGDPQSVYILAYGIDRFTRVNADGSFLFGNLAEGKYTLRLISSLTNYAAFDTGTIEVFSKETTDVKTLALPYRDIMIPQNLNLTYDTMQQVVTIHWNRLNNAGVKGYNLYRKNIGLNKSFESPLNSNLLSDTVFIDSLCMQDQTYEYCISATMENGREGLKGDVKRVTISSYLTVDTIFNLTHDTISTELWMTKDYLNDFAVSSSGDIYLNHEIVSTIQVFDSKMNPESQFETGILPIQKIDITDDRVYTLQSKAIGENAKVLVFNKNGKFINTFSTTDSSSSICAISATNEFLAVEFNSFDTLNGDSIALFSTDGTLKKSWPCENGFWCQEMLITNSNKIYTLQEDQYLDLDKIVVYDFQGNKISEKSFESGLHIEDIAFDSQSQRLYIAFKKNNKYYYENKTIYEEVGKVYVFDSNYSIVALYDVIDGSYITSIKVQNGSCYIGVVGIDSSGKTKDRIIKLNPVQR